MINVMDKGKIVGMKESGMSNREIARRTGRDRGTISRVWSEYCNLAARLKMPGADIKSIQAKMTENPKYKTPERKKTINTEELDKRLRELVNAETTKNRLLGKGHKQKLTNKQIHEKLEQEGFKVSRASVNIFLAKIRKRQKEVFIRQSYELGDRLEYDFGEVCLDCGEGYKVYHMAVLSSPGADSRWAYLYTNQKQGVFLDSHVKYFEMMKGCYKEIVYDNMKNVVHKFIGKNEKVLNPELLKMAAYYGFQINVTNCFKGNEKGHVEGSVKILRNKIFSDKLKFASLDEAREYLKSRLLKLNENSKMEEEKKHLLSYKPALELAMLSENTVNSGSMISVDTCFYSVPEYLVGKKVTVKKYHDEIRIYAKNELVCKHKRIFGNGNMEVDIYHYLNTLLKKPGAIRNSVALKSIPRLKSIFDTHFSKQPKKFIEIFKENEMLPVDEIIKLFEQKTKNKAEIYAIEIVKPITQSDVAVRAVMSKYKELINLGVTTNGIPKACCTA